MITLVRVRALIEIRSGGERQLSKQGVISIVTASLGEQSLVLVVLCVFIATDKNLRGRSAENELA